MGPVLSIGQQAIKFNGVTYTFTPSFRHIAAIAEPDQIVMLYSILVGENSDPVAVCSISQDVMESCVDCDLPDGLLWGVAGSWDGERVVMRRGKIDFAAQVIMAADLLYMGIVGTPFRMKEQSAEKPMAEFNAAEFVGAAVAHLGVPTESAWRMTMVDFQIAMKSKFPDLYAPDLPSATEIDALFGDTDQLL